MNIIELAQKCQLIGMRPHDGIYLAALKQFGALVEAAARADEREGCAKVLEKISNAPDIQLFAAAIRARGTT